MSLDARTGANPDDQRNGDMYRTQSEEQKVTIGLDAGSNQKKPGADAVDSTYNGHDRRSVWTRRQLQTVVLQVALVLGVFGLAGWTIGATLPRLYMASTEFVYTLDESVPDSFLREDRRLLTQMATLQSDAVLVPVARNMATTPDELREAMTVETVNLSEVLRLDIRDTDQEQALAINQAVMDRYMTLLSRPTAVTQTDALQARRTDIVDELSATDSALLDLRESRLVDPGLATAEESLERQIEFRTEQVTRLQALLDNSLARPIARSRRNQLSAELEVAQESLIELETELAEIRTTRAEFAAETAQESALVRDIERFEAELGTIDDEIADRELRPLLTSPVRILSDSSVVPESGRLNRLQGMAVGLLVGLPIAGLLAYRTRKRQLWFGR
jgi:hypothetical protein